MGYLGERHGFMVAVFCFRGFRGLSGQVRQWCLELGLRFLDLDAWMASHGLRYGRDLELNDRDVHPNAQFHERIAEFLESSLRPG
jgi:hypothetical protein